jgi:hypothetical protein
MVVNKLHKDLINPRIASPKGFKAKLLKYFFSNENIYFFLVILIEIIILKTTMYHKYNLT